MSDASSNAGNPSHPHSGAGGLAGGADAMGDNALLSMHEQLQHKKDEPKEGFSIIPIVLIFIGCVLTYIEGIDLAQHSGAFKSNVYDFNWKPGAEVSAPVDPLKAGARIYADFNCKNCHGPEGAGQVGSYPPLAGSPWLVGDPERVIRVVLLGMSGTVTVNGNTVPNGSMPNVGHGMTDAQIAYVLTYVRHNFGNDEPEVTADQVSQVRSTVGGRNDPWKPEEILHDFPLGVHAAAPAAASGTAEPAK